MIEIEELEQEIRIIYDQLETELILDIPSSSIKADFHLIDNHDDRGVIPFIQESSLNLEIYATGFDEAVEVVSAFIAKTQLKTSQFFGVRHAGLVYSIPILHLILSYLIIGAMGSTIGIHGGVIAGLGAILTLPPFLFWVAKSLKQRRQEYRHNLRATGHFENSNKIDETLLWMKVKDYSKWHWIKQVLLYELFYLIPTCILLYFVTSQ